MTTAGRRRGLVVAVLLSLLAVGVAGRSEVAAGASGCPSVDTSSSCGVTAQPGHEQFHGLIAVPGQSWVFETAAHSGTRPGCGDCVWSVALACPQATPGDPDSETCVSSATSLTCAAGQHLYRLYLTTTEALDAVVGTVCLGGPVEPVAVGEVAQRDASRFMRDAQPPELVIVTRPRTATLAGLPTFFDTRTPGSLRPTPVAGGGLVELMSLAPIDVAWQWGDGTSSPPTAVGTTRSHTYLAGGTADATLVVRWGATYTVTYQGITVGPYNAVGRLTARQPLTLPVRTSSPTLVSH